MTHKRLWISAGIIALVIIAGFAISVPRVSEVADSKKADKNADATVSVVSLHDVYKKGTHTISGSVLAPNACTTVSADATLLGNASTTGNVVALSLVMPVTSGICLELPTKANFSVTIAAPAQITITATVNGSIASTTPS